MSESDSNEEKGKSRLGVAAAVAAGAALVAGTWASRQKPPQDPTPTGGSAVITTDDGRQPQLQNPVAKDDRTVPDAGNGQPVETIDAPAQSVLLRFSEENFHHNQFQTKIEDGNQQLVASLLTRKDKALRISVADPLFNVSGEKRQPKLEEARTDAFALFKKGGKVDRWNTVEKRTIADYAEDPGARAQSSVLAKAGSSPLVAAVSLAPETSANLRRLLQFDAGRLKTDIERDLDNAPQPYRAVIHDLKAQRKELDLDFLKLLFILPPNLMARNDMLDPFRKALEKSDYESAEYILRHRAVPGSFIVPKELAQTLWDKGKYEPPPDATVKAPNLKNSAEIIQTLRLNPGLVPFQFFSDVVNGSEITEKNYPKIPPEMRAYYNHPWVRNACAYIYQACGMMEGKAGEQIYNALLTMTEEQLALLKKIATRDASIPRLPNTDQPDMDALTAQLEATRPKLAITTTRPKELDFIRHHAEALLGPRGLVQDTSQRNFLAVMGLVAGLNELDGVKPPIASPLFYGNTLLCDVSSGGLPELGSLVRDAGVDNSLLEDSTQPAGLALAYFKSFDIEKLQSTAAKLVSVEPRQATSILQTPNQPKSAAGGASVTLIPASSKETSHAPGGSSSLRR